MLTPETRAEYCASCGKRLAVISTLETVLNYCEKTGRPRKGIVERLSCATENCYRGRVGYMYVATTVGRFNISGGRDSMEYHLGLVGDELARRGRWE